MPGTKTFGGPQEGAGRPKEGDKFAVRLSPRLREYVLGKGNGSAYVRALIQREYDRENGIPDIDPADLIV